MNLILWPIILSPLVQIHPPFFLVSMELFSSKKRKEPSTNDRPDISLKPKVVKSDSAIEFNNNNNGSQEEKQHSTNLDTFKGLGLCNWICQATSSMGFKNPTEIQSACIPSILKGRSVIGCAETGSGKTAAFALPILQHLSVDPYGIYAVILTPTRELAIQIHEQIAAFGTHMSVRQALIIGGVSMTEQSLALSKRPHIVIATPGRLRHHLESADPPGLDKARYLVLDEADRLLAQGFSSELGSIVSAMTHPLRQTLLFSATMTSSLNELEALASTETLRFDLTATQKVPAGLQQEYLFLPAKVKLCFLVALLRKFFEESASSAATDEDDGLPGSSNKVVREICEELLEGSGGGHGKSKLGRLKPVSGKTKKKTMGGGGKGGRRTSESTLAPSSSSVIVFMSSCRRCAETAAVLNRLGIDCVSLHGMMSQHERSSSLDAFKSRRSPVLVATDVAGRGLDIPTVDLVINADMPKVLTDYIHRVGRTARAGKTGRALSFVTQYDVDLTRSLEEFIGSKLQLSRAVDEERDVLPVLNEVAKARKEAQLQLMEQGFEEKLEIFASRKKIQKKKLLRKRDSGSGSKTSSTSNEV